MNLAFNFNQSNHLNLLQFKNDLINVYLHFVIIIHLLRLNLVVKIHHNFDFNHHLHLLHLRPDHLHLHRFVSFVIRIPFDLIMGSNEIHYNWFDLMNMYDCIIRNLIILMNFHYGHLLVLHFNLMVRHFRYNHLYCYYCFLLPFYFNHY